MVLRLPSALFSLVFLAFAGSPWAQEPSEQQSELPEYERLGLSQTEWNQIMQAKMSLEKVHALLRDGISISEYFKKPWVNLGLSEQQWIKKRRSGLSDDDMRATGRTVTQSEWAVIEDFFIPGLCQWQRHEYLKASAMSGIAAGSLALYAGIRDRSNPRSIGFDYPFPFLLFLVADMLWSSVDIGLTLGRERNPDAARFSLVCSARGGAELTIAVPF
ncbi:MAG: hypothetical protein PHC61_14955 [Chitinivibrionales bacterium]|nr:hypothetical protein [Chitinivibrionales bacterium]